jgi:hypothetical protein
MFSSEMALNSCDRLQLSKPQNTHNHLAWCHHCCWPCARTSASVCLCVCVCGGGVYGKQFWESSFSLLKWGKLVRNIFLDIYIYIYIYIFGYISSRHLGYLYCKLIFSLILVCYSHFPIQLMNALYVNTLSLSVKKCRLVNFVITKHTRKCKT